MGFRQLPLTFLYNQMLSDVIWRNFLNAETFWLQMKYKIWNNSLYRGLFVYRNILSHFILSLEMDILVQFFKSCPKIWNQYFHNSYQLLWYLQLNVVLHHFIKCGNMPLPLILTERWNYIFFGYNLWTIESSK